MKQSEFQHVENQADIKQTSIKIAKSSVLFNEQINVYIPLDTIK
jgi:hypothetical protein